MTAEEQQNIIGRNIKRLLDERDVTPQLQMQQQMPHTLHNKIMGYK